MDYLERDRELSEGGESWDKIWVVMDYDNETPVPCEDRYSAEQYYWSLKDQSIDVKLGYAYEGSFTGSTPFKEVERVFKEVRI